MTERIQQPYGDAIVIDQTAILPGESATIRLRAGQIPSGNQIGVQMHIHRAVEPGPTILIIGGIHGDEVNGIEIVRRLSQSDIGSKLQQGTLMLIPLLNVHGFINFSRDVPDGKDVNRSFPGSVSGSLASRVARILTQKIMPYVDVILDFHTGGASRYNYPQIRYTPKDHGALELAKVFGAPYTIAKPVIAKSLRRTAREMGITALVYEAGESVRLDGFAIQCGTQGVRRVLHHLQMGNMSADELGQSPPTTFIQKSSWVRAPQAGIFEWTRQSGQHIHKGEVVGLISDPFGTKQVEVISKVTGFIIGHNNASVVNLGDALFHIGYEEVNGF